MKILKQKNLTVGQKAFAIMAISILGIGIIVLLCILFPIIVKGLIVMGYIISVGLVLYLIWDIIKMVIDEN